MDVKHLVSAKDIDKAGYDEILRRTRTFIDNGIPYGLCEGKVVATLFFECSTRTMTSFQSGIIAAGGGWVGVTSSDQLSMGKEETWEDTVITYGSLADAIVMRHPEDDAAERAAKVSTIPIINGGSGKREHALAGVYLLAMLSYHLGRPLEGLKIGIYGTPGAQSGGGRCCRALVPLLGMYGSEVIIDALDDGFRMDEASERVCRENGAADFRYDKLENFIGEVDALIVTRAGESQVPKELQSKRDLFVPVGNSEMALMKDNAGLMVMQPRWDEVKPEVDTDPRSIHMKYNPFRETSIAVLSWLLGIDVD